METMQGAYNGMYSDTPSGGVEGGNSGTSEAKWGSRSLLLERKSLRQATLFLRPAVGLVHILGLVQDMFAGLPHERATRFNWVQCTYKSKKGKNTLNLPIG